MKNKLLICLMLIFFVGCSKQDNNKNLRCEKNDVVSDNKIEEVITSTFEDDQIKTADLKIQTTVSDKYIQYMDDLETKVKSKYEDYFDKQGIEINISVGTNTVTTKININFDNLDDNNKAILGIDNTISTYDETKIALQNAGYKCK